MTRSHTLGLLGLGLSVLLVACGGSSGGGSGGNGGQGGKAATGGTGGTGSAVDCATLLADEGGQGTKVDVRIKNNTGADLYVRHALSFIDCAGAPPFIIKGQDGVELPYFTKGPCDSACSHYTGPANCGATATCSPEPVTRIAPQGVLTATWDGVVRVSRSVPSSCLGVTSADGTTDCDAWMKPKGFPISFSTTANTATTCTGQGCACTPDASGTCQLQAHGLLSGTELTATASLAEGATSIDLVFE